MEKVKTYQRYLRLERGLSANTLEAYMLDLAKLQSFLKDKNLKEEDVKLRDLEEFAATLYDLGIAPASQSRILSGVRSYFRFLVLDGFLESDPSELLENPVQKKHLPEVLSTTEVDMLEDSIDLSKWEGQRNKAIIEVLFSCGLRVSELITLTLSRLYLDEGYIRVMGKGSKERLVPISPRAIKELRPQYDDKHQERRRGLRLPQPSRSASHPSNDTHHDQESGAVGWHSEDNIAPYPTP